jgi:hypothetical protein
MILTRPQRSLRSVDDILLRARGTFDCEQLIKHDWFFLACFDRTLSRTIPHSGGNTGLDRTLLTR